ncbi:MAG: hypothetical protein KDB27_08400 [Planctomycetales bacterium]|nr:hypothetical protein [Planctomycetales bacterium]
MHVSNHTYVYALIIVLATGWVARPTSDTTTSLTDSGLAEPDPLVAPIVISGDTSSDKRATFHPHGEQVCASGCAVSRHPTDTLTPERFHQFAERFDQPGDLASDHKRLDALDSLLYYGPQTSHMLLQFPNAISDRNADVLREHLSVTHVRLSIRVVDEAGTIRSWIPPTRVPFDRRHVFQMETERLQPHVTSGTVKRVGVDRLWARL